MLLWIANLDYAATGVSGGAAAGLVYDRRFDRGRFRGLWCLLLVLLAGCIQAPRKCVYDQIPACSTGELVRPGP